MKTTVRFAPSPTGHIHIGNARTALFNWLFALRSNGRFIQRFDDTDTARSTKAFADAILYDLHWLGIFPDAVHAQSKRFDRYDDAVARLKSAGVLYPCFETAEELELRRKVRLSRKLPPVYGREALTLTGAEIAALEAEGRKPHWRFLLPNYGGGDPSEPVRTELSWTDIIRGDETVDLASLSDPVLVREDGTYLYTLPSVVDDIDMGVTHVIRGDDHVTNTAVQIALFRALGAEPPAFGHHNLLTTASGEGLSKRSGALSVRSLREQGIEPMAIASLAVLTGTSENIAAIPSMATLAAQFDPASASKSAAKFDPADLVTLNRTILQTLPYEEVRSRLALMGVPEASAEAFWLTVRGNIDTVADAARWWSIARNGAETAAELSDEDRDFVRTAVDALPETPWDTGTWKTWTDALKEPTGRKGKGLYLPLRLFLTGQPSGPDLSDLLPLLDREGIVARRP
ncbi:MAG: glutamate--tRNA ligase [Rhizobiaceae bacterium]|nr:glutamate--tRNA ligase [Rhizobiaceae bacterium]